MIQGIACYKDLLELIDINEKIKQKCVDSLAEINKFLLEHGKPQGYPQGKSYNDYDSIHGSKKEYHAEDYQRLVEEAARLENMIFLQDSLIENYRQAKKEVDECLFNIKDITVKVKTLRDMGLTQEEVAELVDRSDRQIRRIEKRED